MEYQRRDVESLLYRDLTQWTKDKPKGKKSPKARIAGKCKADMPTKPGGEKKLYCDIHRCNKTHNTEDCFELKQRTKCTKPDKTRKDADKKQEKQVELNAFDKFRTLNVESSDEEDKPSTHAPVNVDNNDSSTSCLLSNNNSDSNSE
eukprot:15312995-Ditylum_brightwellii.AAC.1